jgi:hypothetical protein
MAIACPPLLLRFNDDMTTLTRRRSPDAPDDCWHVYYGDVLDWDDRDPIWQSNRHQRLRFR